MKYIINMEMLEVHGKCNVGKVLVIPQTVFSCRGSYCVGKGASKGPTPSLVCGETFFIVTMNESETDPQRRLVKSLL